MDNLTHTLTGIMLARTGLRRHCPRAGLLMAMAANAPDLDVVTWLWGSETYLAQHRAISHALIAMPLVALIPVLILRLIERKPIPWVRALILSMVAILSHLILDWTNIYGIRFLMPFSNAWFRLDLNVIIDLWVWTLLLLGTLAPAISRLVSSEIGAKKSSGFGWAVFALLGILIYDGTRWVMHGRAVETLNSRLYLGSAPQRAAAFPTQNPFNWSGVVETPDAYLFRSVNLNGEFDPTAGPVVYKAPYTAAIDAARRERSFQVFLDFAQFPLWQVTPAPEPEGAVRVEAIDIRFGTPGDPRFVATAIVDSANRVLNARFTFMKSK